MEKVLNQSKTNLNCQPQYTDNDCEESDRMQKALLLFKNVTSWMYKKEITSGQLDTVSEIIHTICMAVSCSDMFQNESVKNMESCVDRSSFYIFDYLYSILYQAPSKMKYSHNHRSVRKQKRQDQLKKCVQNTVCKAINIAKREAKFKQKRQLRFKWLKTI